MEIDGFPVVENAPVVQWWTIETFVNGEPVGDVSVHRDANYITAVENHIRPKGVDLRVCRYELVDSQMIKGTYVASPS